MENKNMYEIIILILLPLAVFAQTENWVYRYNGSGNGWDGARSIVYGSDGNLYAAGASYESGTAGDLTVISLTTSGDTNWIYTYNGFADNWDEAFSIVYGADGNLYAAGYTTVTGINYDLVVISLTTVGDTNWTYRYKGPLHDIANEIIYGADGNIYVAGTCTDIDSLADFAVISLDTTGAENWFYRYGGPENLWGAEAKSIIYGSDGNLYAAGMSQTTGTMYDFTVISLTTAGDTNWIYRYDGPVSLLDYARSIVYGSDGNIYAAGSSYGVGTEIDFMVISLDTTGAENWIYRYNGPMDSTDYANKVIYGMDGNIYAAGGSEDINTMYDFIVISLTTAGDTNWTYRYNGPGNGGDIMQSIIYGVDGNIYGTGLSYGGATWCDFAVISLATNGDVNWIYRYDGPGHVDDEPISITCDADSNIYVAGVSTGSGTNYDFTVISLGITGIDEDINSSNPALYLFQNTPNPFTKEKGTFISYAISEKSNVNLSIFNILGQRVRILVDKTQETGIHRVLWKGEDDSEEMLPNGLYFYKISVAPVGKIGEFSDIKKLLLLR